MHEANTAAEAGNPRSALQGPEALARFVCRLADAAQRELRLFAPRLAPASFDASAHAALSRFLTRHPRNRLYMLIEDEAQVRRDHERLLELARRTADRFELRVVDEADRGAREMYLVADRTAALWQEDAAHDAARACTRVEAVRLAERFDTAWERAQPAALRTLGLGS